MVLDYKIIKVELHQKDISVLRTIDTGYIMLISNLSAQDPPPTLSPYKPNPLRIISHPFSSLSSSFPPSHIPPLVSQCLAYPDSSHPAHPHCPDLPSPSPLPLLLLLRMPRKGCYSVVDICLIFCRGRLVRLARRSVGRHSSIRFLDLGRLIFGRTWTFGGLENEQMLFIAS